jgi:predicted metal-dependent phosphoesterase TrpH
MKVDLHNHTVHSPDSSTTVRDAIDFALRSGLDGIAITDHNSVAGSLDGLKEASGRLVIVTGMEISTLQGHLLCFGLKEDVAKGMTMGETIEHVISKGGIAVPSHPFRMGTGAGRSVLQTVKVPALETVNGRNLNSNNRKAESFAKNAGIGSTGGSDSHSPSEVGRAYTVIEGDGLSAADVIDSIARGRTKGYGSGQGIGGGAKTLFKIVTEYFQRGRRHI